MKKTTIFSPTEKQQSIYFINHVLCKK